MSSVHSRLSKDQLARAYRLADQLEPYSPADVGSMAGLLGVALAERASIRREIARLQPHTQRALSRTKASAIESLVQLERGLAEILEDG